MCVNVRVRTYASQLVSVRARTRQMCEGVWVCMCVRLCCVLMCASELVSVVMCASELVFVVMCALPSN